MSEWRDMERRHAEIQVRKMQAAKADATRVTEKIRKDMRRNQQKIHVYEWELAFDRPWSTEAGKDSMRRAIIQLTRIMDTNRASLATAEAAHRQAQENLRALDRQLARLDRWDRWSEWLEEVFWPVTIIRALASSHAQRNA